MVAAPVLKHATVSDKSITSVEEMHLGVIHVFCGRV